MSEAQRRQFLEYYSPLILKQADEAAWLDGRDWITNFDFDRDGKLASNAKNWRDDLRDYVVHGTRPSWRIQPTLYSHAIEFMECSRKSLVLLYHVYHAMQWSSIHDWERVEIRIDGVTAGGPGMGETVRFAVVTEHGLHRARGIAGLRFYEEPADGKHLLVWQAPWSLPWSFDATPASPPPSAAELHFVEEDWSTIRARLKTGGDAAVNVDRGGLRNFHYVFVAAADTTAVADLGAATIESNPAGQAFGDWAHKTIPGTEARRIVYELQDTADLMVTHYGPADDLGFFAKLCKSECAYPCKGDDRAWTCRKKEVTRIDLEDALRDEQGTTQVPAGTHDFPAESCDVALLVDPRNGYPWKHWWWGTYEWNRDGKFTGDVYGDPWKQHYYFLHEGLQAPPGGDEVGQPLPDGWHTPAAGGSDGRWLQIFTD